MITSKLSLTLGILCVLSLGGHCDVTRAGSVWPSFQNGGAMSLAESEASALDEEIAWTAALAGYGQSSPVIWDRHVYVTTIEGDQKQTCRIAAYNLGDGSRLWQHEVPNASPGENSNYVSKAAPTPAADARGVICFFEGGNVIALTHQGDVRWERNLVDDYGPIEARHGLSASLEQDDTSAYVWVERSEDPYVLSLDKASGDTNWKVPGLETTSWASPRLVPVAGGNHLVLSGIGQLVGLDPDTGERLWTNDEITGNSTPTPVPLGAGRFLIGATVGRGDDGSGRAAESNGVVTITRNDAGAWQADYLWRARRATSSFGSPIAHNGLAYFVNKSGVLYGLDLATGEELFARRLSGSIWATPLGIGRHVIFFGKDGTIDVLSGRGEKPEITKWNALPEAPPEEAEAENQTGRVLYAAALCDEFVVLRLGDRLSAVRLSKQP